MGVSHASVERVRKVRKDGAPELVRAMEAGVVSMATADEVADLPIEEQKAIVAAGPKAVKEAAKKIHEKKPKWLGRRRSPHRSRPRSSTRRLLQHGPPNRRRRRLSELFAANVPALDAMSDADLRKFGKLAADYCWNRGLIAHRLRVERADAREAERNAIRRAASEAERNAIEWLRRAGRRDRSPRRMSAPT